MKAIVLASVLVLSAACGQVSGRPTAAVASPSVSPVTTPVASPSSTPSQTATPKTSPTLLFAVLEAKGTANAWTYNTVAIAGLDGYARAKTTFTPMPVPALGCMGAILPPSAHVAAGKVFFADAKGVVRSLSINGTVAVAATFPMTSTQQMLSFAVSPDGSKLLGTVFTVPTNAAACSGSPSAATYTFDAYSAPARGTSTLVSHQSWSKPQNVMALTGWDAVGPIGTYPTVWASQGGGPGSTLGVLVRIDATTIKPLAPVTDPTTCQVWDSTASGAFVCLKDGVITGGGTPDQKVATPVSVRGANGSEIWNFTLTSTNGAFGAALSPDTQHVIVCCGDVAGAYAQLMANRDGTRVTLVNGFSTGAWLDSTTMVGTFNTDPLKQPPLTLAYVVANAPGTAVSMGFSGLFIGTVRG